MSITPIGFVVLPITIAIFGLRPDLLVPWAIVMSAFQAASVINIGGSFPIGVTPYFFVTTFVAVRFATRWRNGELSFRRGDMALGITRPLFVLVGWGVISSVILPRLFAGMSVNVPRVRMDPAYTEPLQWTFSNAAQAGYLALNSAFLTYAIWSTQSVHQVRRCIRAFYGAGTIVVGVGVYQLLAHSAGLPFPTEFFNSNLAWEQLVSQRVAGAWRLSSTFNEPSAAGTFLVTWTVFLLSISTANVAGLWCLLLLGASTLTLLLTTSTTAYVTAAIVMAYFSSIELVRLLRTGKIYPGTISTFLIIAGSVVAATIILPDYHMVLKDILWQKSQSESGVDRTGTLFDAMRITAQSWGLGVGLGSDRPSGVIFYIMGNLGIPGLILSTILINRTRSAVRKCTKNRTNDYLRACVRAGQWACCADLLAMSISGADISSPHLWVVWIVTLVSVRHLYLAAEPSPHIVTEEALRALSARSGLLLLTHNLEVRPFHNSPVLLTPDLEVS